jgi:hypothetical protein
MTSNELGLESGFENDIFSESVTVKGREAQGRADSF